MEIEQVPVPVSGGFPRDPSLATPDGFVAAAGEGSGDPGPTSALD
jgi:hypothetical protein